MNAKQHVEAVSNINRACLRVWDLLNVRMFTIQLLYRTITLSVANVAATAASTSTVGAIANPTAHATTEYQQIEITQIF